VSNPFTVLVPARGRVRHFASRRLASIFGLAALLTLALAACGGETVGVKVQELPGVHAPPYVYNTRPPTSGNHLPTAGPYGHIATGLVAERVVHNMEHGAVVIWYKPGDPRLAAQVNQLLNKTGTQCIIAGPYADMDTPVAVTAWGWLLTLDGFDEERIVAFINAHKGKAAPEKLPGGHAVCTAES